jgi:hypothetical protein
MDKEIEFIDLEDIRGSIVRFPNVKISISPAAPEKAFSFNGSPRYAILIVRAVSAAYEWASPILSC